MIIFNSFGQHDNDKIIDNNNLIHSIWSFVLRIIHKVPSQRLLHLDRLEQRLKVPGSESLVVVPLNNLNKQSWSIFQRLRKYLKKVS